MRRGLLLFFFGSLFCLLGSTSWGMSEFERGYEAYEHGNYSAAIKQYTKYLKKHQSVNVYFNRGLAYYALEYYNLANDDFTFAILMDPSDYELWLNRGHARFAGAKIYKALGDFERALELNPRDSSTYAFLGLCLSHLDKHQDAIEAYGIALMEDSLADEVYYNRAIAYGKLNEITLAENDLQAALAINPTTDYYWERAELLIDQERFEEAKSDYSQAIASDSANTALLYEQGVMYYKLSEYDEANVSFSKILALDSTHLSALWGLVISNKELGNIPESLHYYEAIEKIDPKYELLSTLSKKDLKARHLLKDNFYYFMALLVLAFIACIVIIRLLMKRKETAPETN